MTLYGWDASDYDVGRGLTVDRVKAAHPLGIDFMTYKGTERSPTGEVRSRYLGTMLTAARDGGVPFLGVYVVVRSGVSAAVQASTLVDHATAQVPWWPAFPGFFWQVDLERWSYDDVAAPVGVNVAAELETTTKRRAVLYASKGQYGSSALGAFPRWNANYPDNVDEDFKAAYRRAGGDSGPGWTVYGSPAVLPRIWQYTSRARIGAQSTCDADAFRGTLGDFTAMISSFSGGPDVRTTHIVSGSAGFTVPVDGGFHPVRWSDGDTAYTLTGSGVVGHQAKLDLRGLRQGDLVRLRAVYGIPGQSTPYPQALNQESVTVDPAEFGDSYVVESANENHDLGVGTTITFELAVTPGTGSPTGRTVGFGAATRKTILLFA